MPSSEAKMTTVGIKDSKSNYLIFEFKLKYIGEEENVCIYQITGASNNPTVKTGELFLNKTTNQITLSFLKTSASGRGDFSLTCILTKNGKNIWSGSEIQQRDPPVGECSVITKFSFSK